MNVRFPNPVARAAPRREALAVGALALAVAALVGELDPGVDMPRLAEDATILCVLALNALPALTLLALLLALTQRVLLSTWLVALAIGALYSANAAKLGALQTPLLPADLRLLAAPGAAFHLLGPYLHPRALSALALAVGVTALLFRERRLALLDRRRSAALAAAALLTGASLVAGSAPWRQLYRSAGLALEPWSLAESAVRSGLIGGLLLYHWEIHGGDVPAADRDAALALLRRHAPALREALAAAAAPAERPDIVVVQSESLFDPARLRAVPAGRHLHEYARLAHSGRSGALRVPTFGGGTIRTEFEVLTGAPLASLGGVQYPWLELDVDAYPSLARTLGAHGYRRVAIHPNAAAFWNRARAYPALGFERFVDAAAFAPEQTVGLFTSDAALTERVLAELDDDGPPQFVFAISIENHGPFDWRPGLDADRLAAIALPDALDDAARPWLAHYLYLADDADRALGRLADALRARGRRTLLLFYGDHLPDLGPVYAELGFDDGRDAHDQPVPWLLLDSADPRPRRLDARSWMLPGLLLAAAGVHDGGYFDVVRALTHAPGFDADEADTADGLDALARLQLRGELDPVLREALGAAAG
ncbi:MAG TPA: LTA synthase family protein [Dokdonella sp.]